PRSKTVSEWTGIVKDFTKTTGKRPVAAIEKTHIVAYKDALVEAKKAPATIRTRLAALHTLLKYAAENEIIQQNLASGVRIHTAAGSRGTKSREHIPVENLQKLFSSPVFIQGLRPRAGKGEAAYWLPLLALFSGARLEELGQMLVQDVKRTADGIEYFEVTEQ